MKDQETTATDAADISQEDEQIISVWADIVSDPVIGSDCRKGDHEHDCNCLTWEAGALTGAKWGILYEKARNADLKSELSNLLALIHRDGGHREQTIGTLEAIKDAIMVVERLRNEIVRLTNVKKGE